MLAQLLTYLASLPFPVIVAIILLPALLWFVRQAARPLH